jgi:hypothetical protein
VYEDIADVVRVGEAHRLPGVAAVGGLEDAWAGVVDA